MRNLNGTSAITWCSNIDVDSRGTTFSLSQESIASAKSDVSYLDSPRSQPGPLLPRSSPVRSPIPEVGLGEEEPEFLVEVVEPVSDNVWNQLYLHHEPAPPNQVAAQVHTVRASSAVATAEERETALQQVEDGSLMETENGQVEAAGGPAEAVDDHLEVD